MALRSFIAVYENKTETIVCDPQTPPGERRDPCAFVLESAAGKRFCGAPALPGSAYCLRHRRRCVVQPDTDAGSRALRELEREARHLAMPPADLAHLAIISVPELDCADEPRDLAGCIDLVIETDNGGAE